MSNAVTWTGGLGLVKSAKVEVLPAGNKVDVKGLTITAAGVEIHSMPGITEPHVNNSFLYGLFITPSVTMTGYKAVEITNMSNKRYQFHVNTYCVNVL